MSVTASTLAFQMRDSLVATIQAEMHVGGKLATLQDVRKSAQFATGKQPACAVWIPKISTKPEGQGANGRQQEVSLTFQLTLAACSTITAPVGDTPGKIANLDDALAAIEAVLDDGAGNGLVALLNQPNVFGLGGNASQSRLGDIQFYPVINEGDQQHIWAYCEVLYFATTYTTY